MRFLRADELSGQLRLEDDDLVIAGDNASVLPRLPADAFDVVYIDPPFNRGITRRHDATRVTRDDAAARRGFSGLAYTSEIVTSMAYADPRHGDYLQWLAPRLQEARRVLAPHGTLYFHIDYREAHYCKVLLDQIFGRDAFLNEIIWAYDFGGRAKNRWPAKHDTILVYVKDPKRYHFDAEAVDREPYMAPGLVGPEKAARGKLPTDCYSDDTELLTAEGWKLFPALASEDAVATVTADGTLVYDRPVALHAHEYDGPMVHFGGKQLDLLVTPGHSMLVRPKNAAEYEFVSADDLKGPESACWAIDRRMRWTGTRTPRCAVPTVLPPFDLGDWCEFMGWYLSEGPHRQAKRRERIERLLTRMGLTASHNQQLATYLSRFGRAADRHVPRALLELDTHYLERLLQGLMLGGVCTTVSERLADDVQELLLKLGSTSSINVEWDPDPRQRPRLHVRRLTSAESTIWPARHRTDVTRYQGSVHCATVVPNHTLVVRRGGLPIVCGNCWWHTIVPTSGQERTGYPTQKPEAIVRRMVAASCRPDGWCLDFFAGSGTLGAVARALGRRFVLVDDNPEAIDTMRGRLG